MVGRRKIVVKKVKEISEGLLATVVDMVLVSIFFNLEFGREGSKRWSAGDKAIDDLAVLNYQTIKRSLAYLKRKGLIQTVKEELTLPKITARGKKRLTSLLPQYDKKRVWDERVYLVIYDLPVKKNYKRNALREFLKKIGCGMLQESVWLTSYNPKKLIEEFINDNGLSANLILVSSLGKDGTVGEIEISDLMEQVFHLSEINLSYKQFLFEAEKRELNKSQLIFHYLSVLEDDPQLPFELLPKDWVGDKAYLQFQKLVK